MSIFDFTSAANPSKGTNFCNPITASEAQGIDLCNALDGTVDFDSPPRFPGDPAAIARGIFRDGIRDVLTVLINCGVLHTAAERQWCQEELARLLAQLCHGNVT